MGGGNFDITYLKLSNIKLNKNNALLNNYHEYQTLNKLIRNQGNDKLY